LSRSFITPEQVYFYDVFRAHGHAVPHLPHTKEPLQRSSISCLAFAASGLYFSIGYSDGNVYVVDTSYVNAAIDGDGISVHECVFATPRDQSLSSVTAVAFGGQDENERIIVGDRCGHVRTFACDVLVCSVMPELYLHF
jgi:hypothetical protein